MSIFHFISGNNNLSSSKENVNVVSGSKCIGRGVVSKGDIIMDYYYDH